MTIAKGLLLTVVLSVSFSTRAVVNCEPWSDTEFNSISTPYELNVSQVNSSKESNTTVGNSVSDYTLLYTVNNANVGLTQTKCSESVSVYYTMLNSDYGASIGNYSGNTIYPTSVPGLGISIFSRHTSVPIKLYPSTATGDNQDPNRPTGFWVDIKLWKIPGDFPITAGSISFTGPTIGQLLMKSGNTFSSSDLSRLWDNNKGYIASSRILKGTLMIQPTTCDLVMPNKVVNMGNYDGSNGQSSWKDASFNLKCPKAYGYGGTTSSAGSYKNPNGVESTSATTASTKKNNPIRIQIVPRTAVVDANSGIIGLDGTGAQGYGIQLAWGDSGTLGSGTPAKPVILNSWTLANTLNSAYSASAYAIGASAISTSADGTIKMAARYVRTTGATQPGPAKAGVEVIASYQ